jgi:RNA polymerase sigma-70 factor (ECF subfamily)
MHLWQDGTDLRAWLFTILHNQYVNHIRRAVREGTSVGLNDGEPLLSRAPQQGKRLELRDVERAIAKLPEEQRIVILLVGLEGMRYEQVAAVLDVPVGTIRSRLSRGREALRRLTGAIPDDEAESDVGKPGTKPPRYIGAAVRHGISGPCWQEGQRRTSAKFAEKHHNSSGRLEPLIG